MSQHNELKLYSTIPHACSYLADQEATTLFVDPEYAMDASVYGQLSQMGFRRSGSHLYRPNCADCQQCVATRVPVAQFSRRRGQQRIWRKNQDLETKPLRDLYAPGCYELYRRYISERHRDGDMYPPSREQFHSFLSDEWGVTRRTGFYLNDELVAVAVYDQLDDGLSAIYTFFKPELERRSLGGYAILWQIEECRRLNLPYLYLGYWIRDCRKMQYKLQYRPVELFLRKRWVLLN